MRNSVARRYLIAGIFLFVVITLLFSLLYRGIEARLTQKFIGELRASGEKGALLVQEKILQVRDGVKKLLNFAGREGTFLRTAEPPISLPFPEAEGVEIFGPGGDVVTRFYRSREFEELMASPATSLSGVEVGLVPWGGELHVLYRSLPPEEGLSVSVLVPARWIEVVGGMRVPPLAGGVLTAGAFEGIGASEDFCSACHGVGHQSDFFPVPHAGFVKEGGVFLSGAVGGDRFVFAPVSFEGVTVSYLFFRFSEGDLQATLGMLRSVLFPSWILLILTTVTVLFLLYGRAERSFQKLLHAGEGEGDETEEGGMEELPPEVASVAGRMRELRDRLSRVEKEFKEEREKLTAELTKLRENEEGVIGNIRKINEFINSLSTIMYPDVLGERIVTEVQRLTGCELVILHVEAGSEGEGEVFSRHSFRRDTIVEIFLKKMESEFKKHAPSVREPRETELIDDPFFSRFAVYNHPLERVFLLPIVVRDVRMGTLALFKRGKSRFTDAEKEFISAIATHLGTAIENSHLHEEVKRNYFNTIRALVRAIEEKDRYTRGHSERVTRLALAMGEKAGLSRKRLRILYQAAVLHDIGKIGIDLSILNKKGALSEEEWRLIRQHPVIGQRIIEPLTFLKEVKACIREHHERFDGKGYPEGRRSEELTLEGRILSVADAFDAMTSDRPYRRAMTEEEAIEELKKNAGKQFDPYVVDLFIRV
ncbi:MAG: HD domain-containing protein, partial [Deltaproteobacteria bacterium]